MVAPAPDLPHGALGGGASVFRPFGFPGPPGPRPSYFLELLLPLPQPALQHIPSPSTPDMEAKTQELVCVLAKLATLLEDDGEQHWCRWMLRAKVRLENWDYSGLDYLLSAYGGMGSFNDFVAGQSIVAGRFAWKPGYKELNDEIDDLRSKAWSIAKDIMRNHVI
jgi:hypothetical protein